MSVTTSIVFSTSAIVMPVVVAAANDAKLLEAGLDVLNNKVVAAICLSPVVLARAGILKGKDATVFPSNDAVEELKNAGVKYVDKPVVISGKIITARDPKAAEEFAKTIAEEI
jgi:protease I